MKPFKVALFDVDGVLILPPKLFSNIYCEKYGVNLENLLPFYASKEFKDCSIGKLDLTEAITIHDDKWHWEGNPAELIDQWLKAENFPNQQLLKIVEELRRQNVKVYIVTQQEKYRAAFLRDIVFKDKFDGFFVSCDFGLHKDTAEFWQEVLIKLKKDVENLEPADIVYFDDKQKLVDVASSQGVKAYLYTRLQDATQRLG
jgi:HAD superfamily hydrolase (TIGR01509 family)